MVTKKFTVSSRGSSVELTFEGVQEHVESFPYNVAIAMGNQLIKEGRKVLKRGVGNVKKD
jgi:hypothetical protein